MNHSKPKMIFTALRIFDSTQIPPNIVLILRQTTINKENTTSYHASWYLIVA